MKKFLIAAFLLSAALINVFSSTDSNLVVASKIVYKTNTVTTVTVTPTTEYTTNYLNSNLVSNKNNNLNYNGILPILKTNINNLINNVNFTSSSLQYSNKWTVVPYFTFAPKAKQNYGGGLFATYEVNQYLGAGGGLDYLGQLTMPSGQVTLKAKIKPLEMINLNWQFTPFAFAGVAVPVFGNNSSVVGIAGTGMTAKLSEFKLLGKDADFTVGAAAVKWSGTVGYDGTHYEIFPVLHIYF